MSFYIKGFILTTSQVNFISAFLDKLWREAEQKMPLELSNKPGALFFCLAVDEDYQGRKIAGQLINLGLELLREKSYFSFAMIHAFNHFTKKAAENEGFEVVHSVDAKEFHWKGFPLYSKVSEPHGCVTRMIKILKKYS